MSRTSSDTAVPQATSPFAVRGALATLTASARARLFDRGRAADPHVEAAVRAIIDDVRSRGDTALRDLALRFDHARLDALEVPRGACERALRDFDREVRKALEHAATNLALFHRTQLPAPLEQLCATLAGPDLRVRWRVETDANIGRVIDRIADQEAASLVVSVPAHSLAIELVCQSRWWRQ